MAKSSSPILPLPAERILASLDPEYKVLRKIRDKDPRISVHIRLKGSECLLKVLKNNKFWKRPERRLRFQKEIYIYSRLQNIGFSWFHYPKLLETDTKYYILTEFIKNNPVNRQDSVFYFSAMKAVLEFNTCNFPFWEKGGPGWIWEKTNRWKHSRSSKTLRNLLEGSLLKGKVPFSLLLRMTSFWRKAISATPELKKPLLVHRDIFKANILCPAQGKIYFVDFEKAGMEKRWVFIDALKIAQAEPLFYDNNSGEISGFPRFYISLLENYWEGLLLRRSEIIPGKTHFKTQLKFCLLGWALKKVVKEDLGNKKEKDILRFIDTVILGPEEKFDHWFYSLPLLKS